MSVRFCHGPRTTTAILSIAHCWVILACCGCGRPTATDRPQLPDQVLDFKTLYGRNCSGCHGADGTHGPAPPLNDRLLLAMLSADELTRVVTEGRQGSLMPAFSREHGGSLTTRQVSVIAKGIRNQWGAPPDIPTELLPPYHSPIDPAAADVDAGARRFNQYCSKCHGTEGKGGKHGALNDGALLVLLSDQALRRLIITGRPDLGMPSYLKLVEEERGDLHGANREIDDLVAYLATWRRPIGGTPVAPPATPLQAPLPARTTP